MITPVNSIVMPKRFVTLCSYWYNGSGDTMYAVASTGGLTTGTHRPVGCDTPEEWYLTLWRGLATSITGALCDPGSDYAVLVEFAAWVDATITRLEGEYDLARWSPDAWWQVC
jgi:hypothetical protein